MADIIISKVIQLKCTSAISEVMSTSLGILEIANFNPTESLVLASGIYDISMNPSESMTYTN